MRLVPFLCNSPVRENWQHDSRLTASRQAQRRWHAGMLDGPHSHGNGSFQFQGLVCVRRRPTLPWKWGRVCIGTRHGLCCRVGL